MNAASQLIKEFNARRPAARITSLGGMPQMRYLSPDTAVGGYEVQILFDDDAGVAYAYLYHPERGQWVTAHPLAEAEGKARECIAARRREMERRGLTFGEMELHQALTEAAKALVLASPNALLTPPWWRQERKADV